MSGSNSCEACPNVEHFNAVAGKLDNEPFFKSTIQECLKKLMSEGECSGIRPGFVDEVDGRRYPDCGNQYARAMAVIISNIDCGDYIGEN